MNKKQTNILFIFMAVIAIVILIGTGAYAYYQTNINGTTSGTIARWSFKANDQTENFNIDLGKIYPGKNGIYNIELSAEDSDLDVYYELFFTVSGRIYDSSNTYSTVSHLYFDSSYTKQISTCSYRGIYGVINAGEKITIPLYYNYSYNYSNNTDYADGSHVESSEIQIVGQQLNGYSNEIPMYLLGSNYRDGYIMSDCPV